MKELFAGESWQKETMELITSKNWTRRDKDQSQVKIKSKKKNYM
jgi:hypothetical protein